MNRELKLRAWMRTGKQMYGVIDLYCESDFYDYFPEDLIFMQYTGLKDKNGVEIYEGDIVEFKDYLQGSNSPWGGRGVVGFDRGSFIITDEDIGIKHFRWIDYEVEVIGNIYENPELL